MTAPLRAWLARFAAERARYLERRRSGAAARAAVAFNLQARTWADRRGIDLHALLRAKPDRPA